MVTLKMSKMQSNKKKVNKKIIMQCASIYPAKVSDSNLKCIKSFKKNILILTWIF